MTRRNWTAAAAVAMLCVIGFALPARAQTFMGRLDIVVQDPAGAPIPGAHVEISGGQILPQTTDALGQTHFLGVAAGLYDVSVTSTGFPAAKREDIEVLIGTRTRVAFKMAKGAPEAVSSGGSSVGAATSLATTSHIELEELQNIPAPRDVWSVIASAPTVYTDKINVGGSTTTQANFNAKGARATDNTWTLDGVPVNDMGDSLAPPALVTGSSIFYYDYDSFQEVAVASGGADVQAATAGAGVNLSLKSGMNQPSGTMRASFGNDTLQGVNISPDLAAALGNTAGRGNRIDEYLDRGFDVGGPMFKDQLWVWGTMAWTTDNLVTLTGNPDDSSFMTWAAKVDGRANDKVRGNFTIYRNNRSQEGRGASSLRQQPTTWNQDAPTIYYKGEGNFVLNDHFFASARAAVIHGGFDLEPQGGLTTDYYFDAGLVAHNSFYAYTSDRTQRYAGGDANYIVKNNDLKFGGSWRSTPVDTQQIWPASHLVATWTTYPSMLVQAARNYAADTGAQYLNAFVQDTITLDRLTVTGGVRWDHQTSSLDAASVPGVTGVAVLPALNAPDVSNVFNWSNLTPRLGVTYAANESHKTIVRATYAQFASQLPGNAAAFVSPIQHSYAYYNAVDRNGDGVAQLSEVLFGQGLQGAVGFDPNNPGKLASVNTVDPNVKAPMTMELTAGADQSIGAKFAVGATFTYRKMTDLLWTPLTGVTQANYHQTGTLSGSLPDIGAFNVPLYALSTSAAPPGNGMTETNRPGYHQQYTGLELSATKRLSNRWMARVAFSTNQWREYFDNPATAILDPTPAPPSANVLAYAGPGVTTGGTVVRTSAGTGQSTQYMTAPSYQIVANGLYEMFWGITISGHFTARPGYAEPFFESGVNTGDPTGTKSVLLVPTVDTLRLPSVTTIDGRLEKSFRFGKSTLAAGIDMFNIVNAATVLGKQYDLHATGFDTTQEIMQPRMVRIEVRYIF